MSWKSIRRKERRISSSSLRLERETTRIQSGSDPDSDWMHGWRGESDERASKEDPHQQRYLQSMQRDVKDGGYGMGEHTEKSHHQHHDWRLRIVK